MSTAISWVFEAAVKPDGLDDYRALAQEISADNEASEPDQAIFEWFIDDHDVHIYERYADSAALGSQMLRIGHFPTLSEAAMWPGRTKGTKRTEMPRWHPAWLPDRRSSPRSAPGTRMRN